MSGNLIEESFGIHVLTNDKLEKMLIKKQEDLEKRWINNVFGIVDKSVLEATGNIIVRQGIFGKGEGYIKAGKSLWAKFINDTTVEVEENVTVYDSIVNSNITAMKNIVVRGKKAQIIGGHLLATEEICAKKIGSPGGGTETILEVGIDPRAKKRLLEIQKKQADFAKEIEAAELDIQTLEQQKKLRKKLPQEKEEKLKGLKEKCSQISQELEEMTSEIEKIQAHLDLFSYKEYVTKEMFIKTQSDFIFFTSYLFNNKHALQNHRRSS